MPLGGWLPSVFYSEIPLGDGVSAGNLCDNIPMNRIDSTICPVSRLCGACSDIDVPYAVQLERKQSRIASLFADIAGEECLLMPIAGMDDPFHYRNKIVSPFAPGKRLKSGKSSRDSKGKNNKAAQGGNRPTQKREILCGMYAAHSHRIVPAAVCPVENEVGRRVIDAVRAIMNRYGVAPYNEDTGEGFMRHAVIRVGHESGEVLVTLVTNGRVFKGAKNFAREIVKRCPEVVTVVQNINTHDTNAILGTEEHVLYGPGFILDTLCGLSFRISSQTFYQVNAVQTEVLYRAAIAMADLDGLSSCSKDACPITLLDAYCGTGTIGLVAASLNEGVRVIGVDKVAAAIDDARENARHNGIENAEFVAQDAGEFMMQHVREGEGIDVLLLDPPRAGASEAFLTAAVTASPSRIVYISCNPESQVRDAAHLVESGYRVEKIQPVDMFPHTAHIECIVSLSRK